jgi:MoxR-like ATPase
MPTRGALALDQAVVTALRLAAEQGHCLVVGEAGAGKSGAIHDLIAALRDEARDVVFLAVDRLAAEDEAGLRATLGLEHHLDDVLANWPGTEPGFIVIDALDRTLPVS